MAGFRRRHDWAARTGLPAHVTLIGGMDAPDAVEQIEAALDGAARFELSLNGPVLLGAAACLVPIDSGVLETLTRRLESLPGAEEYSHEHHLTIARDCGTELLAEIRARLAGRVPLRGVVREVQLFERSGAEAARLVRRLRLA